MNITENINGTIINVFVKPSQPKFKLIIDGDEIIIFSTEEPVKGKVNKQILKELAKFFNAKVELLAGVTSRQKRLLILGVERSKVEQLLLNENSS
ncbi:MAG TPA: DUF167 domain-containing protein [Candidatus Bathyarchaeia archaeon]